MRTLNAEIVKGFGLHLKRYVRVREAYMCETNEGLKALKKVNMPLDKLLFMHSAKEHLAKRGFENIDRYRLSVENTPYFIYDNEVYILSDWIEGRECDFENPLELNEAVKNLALLHNAAKYFEPMEGSKIKSDLGEHLIIFERRAEELPRLRKVAGKRKTEFDQVYMDNYVYYHDLAQASLELLKHSAYFSLVEKAKEEKSFCHHDYTYHNLIIGNNGGFYVIDFDYCCYEIRLYDLADMMKRNMRKCHWDIEKARDMLKIYNHYIEEPLTKEEMVVLCSFLMYPQKFWRVANRYYNSKRTWSMKSYLNRIYSVVGQKEFHKDFIEQFKKDVGL